MNWLTEVSILPALNKFISPTFADFARKGVSNMQGDIGELLRSCRLRGEMTQKRLASLLRVHDSVISRVETGEMPPSYALVKQWAKVTNCEDLISADLGGKESWKKMKMLEETMERLKEIVSVSFLRIKGKEKRHAVKARG